MPVNRAIIVRHGETDYNVEHRWQGQLDIPLNATGHQQAQSLADYLKNSKLDAIYSSDLKRAYATAQVIAQIHNLPIKSDKRLREFRLGIFEGLTRTDIAEKYPYETQAWDDSDNYVVPNGESRIQTQERVYQAWQDITISDANTILITSHGGTIRQLMKKLYPQRDDLLRVPNTSITILERDEENQWQVVQFSITPHLK